MDAFKIKVMMYGKRVGDSSLQNLGVEASKLLASVEMATGAKVDAASHTEWTKLVALELSMCHANLWLSELGYAVACWIAGDFGRSPRATPADLLWCLSEYTRSAERRDALGKRLAEEYRKEAYSGRPPQEEIDKLYASNIASFRSDWCLHGEIRDYVCVKAVSYAYDWYMCRNCIEIPPEVATRIKYEAETELSSGRHAAGGFRVGNPSLGDVMRRKGMEWIFSRERESARTGDMPE